MKNNKIILGTLVLSAIAVGSFLFTSKENIEPTYTAQTISLKQQDSKSWNNAAAYYNSLRKNVNTGQIEEADYKAALQHVKQMYSNKTTAFTFVDEGPDNVGGRTRAISVHPSNDDYIIAGAVTGGLFKSNNGGNNWSRVQGWDNSTELLSISSTAITNDGTIYVATGGAAFELNSLSGENSSSQQGDGLWYSTNNGSTFTQVAGTENKDLTKVTADLSKNDVVYIAGNDIGIKKMTNKGALVSLTGTSLTATTDTQDVKVSPDGNVVIVASEGTVWSSQDAGATLNKATGSSNSGLISGSSARNECAVAYNKNANGKWNCYVARAIGTGYIGGVWMSEDNGVTWSRIGQQYTSGPGVVWDPTGNQGIYDLVIDAVPNSPNTCILGGNSSNYKWTKSPNSSPASGTWEAITFGYVPLGNPRLVHADMHRYTWNSKGQLLIGNDGGVAISMDSTLTSFYAANRGYNVTQFYGIAYGNNGEVLGGTQDNGTQMNNHNGFFSWLEHIEVKGGDGFECEMSFLNPKAFIASTYNTGIERFDGIGNGSSLSTIPTNGSGLGDGNGSTGTFYTPLRLFEDDNDTDTQDSIQYIAKESRYSGEIIKYTSLTNQLPLVYTINQDLIVDFDTIFITSDTITASFDTLYVGDTLLKNGIVRDTIMLPDYKQSLFVTHTDLGIFLTRDVMRFGVPTEWWKISTLGNQAHSFEFSKDGNCLWIGTTGGTIIRVMGLDSAYSFAQADISNSASPNYKLDIKTLYPGGAGIITDISVDKDNPNKVIVVRGGTGNSHVFYTTNATATTPTWSTIDGTGTNSLPNAPVFGVEIIANASTNETVIVGTEFGAFVTENINGNATEWSPLTNETGLVPVFDVRQQWRSRDQGVSNPYAIYLGTHGRGIWRSDNVLSTEEKVIESKKEELSNVVVYPNPMQTEGKIGFEINSTSDVSIKIYDLQGKIINKITKTQLSKGKHVLPFSVQNYPSGTYIVTLETNTASEVTKFIKY